MYTRGVTIMELLIVIGIIALVGLGIIALQRNVFEFSRYFQNSLTAHNDAQTILRPMVQEIRSAARAETGGYHIKVANEDELVFYSDIDDTPYVEEIRYFTENDQVKKSVISPSGDPLTYDPADADVSILARNADVSFAYYDSTYTGNEDPLEQPVRFPDIRLIEATISIEADPNKSPEPITVSSQVTIRNLKDNL